MRNKTLPFTIALLAILLAPPVIQSQSLAIVSAASYQSAVAPNSVAAILGASFTGESVIAQLDSNGQLPTDLGGLAVVIDGRPAGLYSVSPAQINCLIPAETPAGTVPVTVKLDNAVLATGSARVQPVAPGLFALDGSGSGLGAITNAVTYAPGPFKISTAENPGCDKRTRLAVFATGLRNAGNPPQISGPVNVVESISATFTASSGVEQSVGSIEYAGPAGSGIGLDQINIVLAPNADALGEISLRITAGSAESNTVTFTIAAQQNTLISDCHTDGSIAFVYNSVTDLLAGDLWDTTTPAKVASDLSATPGDWPLMGVGTTDLPARNGEVIGFGTAGRPDLTWADPLFPVTVRTLDSERLPFLGIAAGNPVNAIVAEAVPGQPIHQQVVELAEQHHLAFAGVRVAGRFAPVSISVAHNLLKTGTPLTDPAADKSPYQLFFTQPGPVEWDLSGFYAAARSLQTLVSVPGAPVHLHGMQLDRSLAGHVGSAVVESAEIRLYPLPSPVTRDADLVIAAFQAAGTVVSFQVANTGSNTVTHATVQGFISETVAFQVQLEDLAADQPRPVMLALPSGAGTQSLRIVVDPFNDILEGNEDNNTAQCPCPPPG